ncbi:MAG: hypothetical protein ACR2M1_15790 [Gemmatimonadaceae bacterium]
MSRRFTAAEVQEAVDAGLVTWERVLDGLRNELHIPDGAIEEWRAGDREMAAVLVEWVERDANYDNPLLLTFDVT